MELLLEDMVQFLGCSMGQHLYKDKQMVDLDQRMGYIQVDKQVVGKLHRSFMFHLGMHIHLQPLFVPMGKIKYRDCMLNNHNHIRHQPLFVLLRMLKYRDCKLNNHNLDNYRCRHSRLLEQRWVLQGQDRLVIHQLLL